MKKLLFLLIIILFSCQKEPLIIVAEDEFCWACTSETIFGGSNWSESFDVCNLTELEIRSFESDNSYGVIVNDYGPDIAARKITCVKKE